MTEHMKVKKKTHETLYYAFYISMIHDEHRNYYNLSIQ